MKIYDLDTPAVVVNLDILEENIVRMQELLNKYQIKNRPHVKTHKIPAISHMQINAGAIGITCQKLSEAEVMVNAGLKDILIPFNIMGKKKLERLVRLNQQAKITVAIDSEFTLSGINEAGEKSGKPINILIECDIGGSRTGVQSPHEVIQLAKLVERSIGLKFKGLLTFKGGLPDMSNVENTGEFFKETVRLMEKNNIQVETISAGGTVFIWNAWHKGRQPFGINETRPGLYIYNDCIKVKAAGVATFEQCAMRVITTVISRPTTNRVILDAGSKTLSYGGYEFNIGFGHIVKYPKANIIKLSDEHATCDFGACTKRPNLGERLTIIPNNANGVTNENDVIYGFRGDKIETIWPIMARGKTH